MAPAEAGVESRRDPGKAPKPQIRLISDIIGRYRAEIAGAVPFFEQLPPAFVLRVFRIADLESAIAVSCILPLRHDAFKVLLADEAEQSRTPIAAKVLRVQNGG